MKKILCLIALMIATVSLASAQTGAYSLTKSSGTYTQLFPGTGLELSTVKYVPAEGDAKAQNEAVTFAYGADGVVQATSLTDIKGLPLGFDFEFGGITAKYFAINATGLVYLSDTETFKVWPAQPYNALTASSTYSSVPVVGLSGNQSKVRITDDSSIAYYTKIATGASVFTAQFKNVELATNFNGTTTVKANMQVKLYEETGRVEVILGSWTMESTGTIPGIRIGLAGLNGDLLNLKGTLDEPQTSTTSGNITNIDPATIVSGTTYAFDVPAPCKTPTVQATELTADVTSISAEGSFTPAAEGVDKYLIVLLQGDATFTPADGEKYTAKATPSEGVSILDYGTNTTYRTQILGNIAPSTAYTVRVYAVNDMCKGGPLYNLNDPAEVKFTTCLDMPSGLAAAPKSTTSVNIDVAADFKGDQIVVAVTSEPQKNFSTGFPEDYGEFGTPTGTYEVGDIIEGGGRVIYVGGAKDGIVADGLTPNDPVYVRAWSTDGAGNYGTIYQDARTSTELQLPYAADYHKMGTYMEPCGYIVNDEYLSGAVTVMTGADGHTAANGFNWKSAGAAAVDEAVGTITLPAFQIPANGARMSFDYQSYIWGRFGNSPVDWIDHILEVQLSENGSDFETIFKLDEENQPETIDANFHSYSIAKEAFAKFAGKKVTLRFHWTRYSDAWTAIQNIFIEEAPEIDYPTALTTTAIDGGDVTLDWTDRYAEAAKWEVRYKKVEAEEWSEPVATTEKPYTVKGLDLSSTYNVQVRVVADEKVSPWADLTVKTGLGAPVDITFEATPFEDGWEAKQFAVEGTAITLTDDAVTNWRYNTNYGLMYSGNYDRALVTPAIKLSDEVTNYTITITTGRPVTSALKGTSYIAVSKDNGATWKLADAVTFDGLSSSVQMDLSGNVMVALCIAKGNSMFYIKGFSLEKTPSQFVLGPEDISAKKAYIIYTDARGGLTVASEDATTLSGTQQSGVGQEQSKDNVLQQFAFVGYEGTYYLYSVGAQKYVSASGLTESATNAIQFADADASTVRLLFDASHNMNLGGGKQYLCDGWSSKDAGNSFKIELAADFDQSALVEAIAAVVKQQKLNDALAAAIAQAQAAYAVNSIPAEVSTEGLITEATQFSSPNTTTEGQCSSIDEVYPYLLDNDANTYWHSSWEGGQVPMHTHYLQVELNEELQGEVLLQLIRRNVLGNHVTLMSVEASADNETYAPAGQIYLPFAEGGETVTGAFVLPETTKYLRLYADETAGNQANLGYWHAADLQLFLALQPSKNVKNADVAAGLQEALAAAKAVENATQADIDALVQALSLYNANIDFVPTADTETLYFTAEQLRDEVANMGQALIGILGVTTTGDKYITGGTQTDRASADGTLAGVRAPQETEYMEVLPAEGGYYLRQHTAEAGQGYLACVAGGNFSVVDAANASVWTVLGPSEEGYGTISGFDDLYTDIEKVENDYMVRFITAGQYMNGQTFGATGGLRGGTGAWSFNYVRNANYVAPVNYRPALEEAITALEEALEEHLLDEPLVTIKGEGLITSADQFASEYSDSDEGKDFGALIDNEPSTFWHTDWHGTAPEGAHSFDVSLPENQLTSFVVTYTGRYKSNNCSPIAMTVYGKTDDGEWEVVTNLTQEDGLGAYAGQGHSTDVDALSGGFFFQTEKAYTNFRFEAHAVWGDAGVWTDLVGFEMPEGAQVNEEKCFNYSEFQMYEAAVYKYDIDPAVAAGYEQGVEQGKALLNNEEVADNDEQLKTATDALNGAVEALENAPKVVFTYTIAIEGAAEGGAIIDGEECTDGMEITGLEELTAEDVTPVQVEGYEAVVTVENGVITVTYTQTTSINAIASEAQRSAIYNLQGQRLNAAGRGLNVVGGKKVLKK